MNQRWGLCLLCTLLGTIFAAPRLTAQQAGAQDQLNQGIARVNAQELDEGIAILTDLVERDQDNGRAWLWLGLAHRRNEELEQALWAYERASEIEASAPRGLYQVGTTHALLGHSDQAFEWLQRAKRSGRFDMTTMDADPDTESLRDDPRYAELLPSAMEFAEPFVEPTRILQEWRGEAANDQFGWIARNAGDVDGDGIDDVVTSAPTSAEGGPAAGKVYVYSSATGALLWSALGEENDQLGLGIETAGDLDADGAADIIAGAPGGDRAVVYSGRDGRELLTLEGSSPGERFGHRVSDVGDVDGDGIPDLLVGAPQNDEAGEDAGAAYVFSGRTGALLLELRGEAPGDSFGSAVHGWALDGELYLIVGAPNAAGGGRTYVYTELTDEPGFVIEPDASGSQLGGMFVSVVGDVDRDGVQDIYASDFSDTALGPNTGKAYVHSGATGKRLHVFTGENAGDGYGIGTGDAGDLNGDGFDDVVVGAWQFGAAAPSGGKVTVHSGKDGRLLQQITGKVMGETFGFDTTGLGDVDGDGIVDLLLTSAWSAVSGARSGRMYIVAGDPEAGG